MGTAITATARLRQTIEKQDRSYAWVARQAHIPYKRILAEVKNGTSPLSLDTAIVVSAALGLTLPAILEDAAAFKVMAA